MTLRRNAARRARRGRKGGFTIVEVVVAMAVMVFGIMAIVGLQSHTVQINSLARQMSIANQIAQTWLERMKQDAHRWVEIPDQDTGFPTPVQILAPTFWLQQVNAAPGRFQIVPTTGATSGAYDFQGNELITGTQGTPFFCTSFRPAWVYIGRSIRMDVRVFWPRERAGAIVGCVDNDASLSPGGPLVNSFHIVYLSTVIMHTRVIR